MDLAILRICRRNGWSIEQMWDALSDWERGEWLAYDLWVAERLNDISEAMAKQDKYTPESYVMLVMETL